MCWKIKKESHDLTIRFESVIVLLSTTLSRRCGPKKGHGEYGKVRPISTLPKVGTANQ
jgi:hypothetical protein